MEREEAKKRLIGLVARREDGLANAELPTFIDECFTLLEQHPEEDARTRVAIILSGIVHEGLSERVREYLNTAPQIPFRAYQVLEANLMRMAGY